MEKDIKNIMNYAISPKHNKCKCREWKVESSKQCRKCYETKRLVKKDLSEEEIKREIKFSKTL